MIKLTSTTDPQLSRILPPYRPPTLNALQNLHQTDSPDPSDRGFVGFVEANDTINDINAVCHRDISTRLEGAFLDGLSDRCCPLG